MAGRVVVAASRPRDPTAARAAGAREGSRHLVRIRVRVRVGVRVRVRVRVTSVVEEG